MINIHMMVSSKRLNSTKSVSLSDSIYNKSYSCNFLDAQSIMNPVIVIEKPDDVSDFDMMRYNYAYIPALKRNYFISNTVVIDSKRYAYYLQEDVLATYRTTILESTQYVLRATDQYNDYITDTMYPTVPLSNQQRFAMSPLPNNIIKAYDAKSGEWSDISFFNKNYDSGSVIFGVTGQGNVSVDYYVCTVTEFKAFINQVVNTTPTGFSWGNLPTGVQAALSNFLQYITFAKWIPFMPLAGNRGSAVTQIYLGNERFDITAWSINAGLHSQRMRFSLTIPDHPLVAQHGYYNLSPYREVNFFFLPIGNIPIDVTKIWGASILYCSFIVDLASGNTEFIVSTVPDDINYLSHIIYSTVANIGIDLSLTDFSMSMEAALASGLSAFISNAIKSIKPASAIGGGSAVHTSSAGVTHGGHGGSLSGGKSFGNGFTNARQSLHGGHGGTLPTATASTAVTVGGRPIDPTATPSLTDIVADKAKDIGEAIGNALQPLGDIAGAMSDFIASSFGQTSTSGFTGSFLMYMATYPVVYCWFYKHGEEDYDRFGRPYFQRARLSTIHGFCLCKDAYISFNSILTSNTIPAPLTAEKEAINNLLNTGIYRE